MIGEIHLDQHGTIQRFNNSRILEGDFLHLLTGRTPICIKIQHEPLMALRGQLHRGIKLLSGFDGFKL